MSSLCLWDYIHSKLSQAALENLYTNYKSPFLVDLREQLKFWIEENLIHSNSKLDPENPQHHPTIVNILHAFIQKIDEEVVRLQLGKESHSLVCKLIQVSGIMKNELAFPESRVALYRLIRRTLNVEQSFVQQAKQIEASSKAPLVQAADSTSNQNSNHEPTIPTKDCTVLSPSFAKIANHCLELKIQTGHSSQLLRGIRQKQNEVAENFCLQKKLEDDLKKQIENGPATPEEPRNIQQELREVADRLQKTRTILGYFLQELVTKHKGILNGCIAVQTQLIQNEVLPRKRERTWEPGSVDIIHTYCADLAEVLIRCRLQLVELQNYYPTVPELPSLQFQFEQLYSALSRTTLVITAQPSQVIKKATRFNAELRFLAGSRSVPSSVISVGQVTASILNKDGVKNLLKFDQESKVIQRKSADANIRQRASNKKSGSGYNDVSKVLELANEQGKLETIEIVGEIFSNVEDIQEEGAFTATFEPQIKVIWKNDKGPGGSKLDVSYWILFHCSITETIGNVKQERFAWVLSNPIKVNTHADQKSHALETIIWLNAMDEEFSDERPKDLPWPNVAKALNRKCLEMTNRSLTEDQLLFLKQKAFSIPLKNGYVPNGHLTFNQFCKDNFVEYPFTFWNWFYEIMKLVAKHLCGTDGNNGPWQDGLIDGFLGRDEAQDRLLLNKVAGAFILRFSESELGGISIVCLQSNGAGGFFPFSIKPATNDCLSKHPLAERVLDLVVLSHLLKTKHGNISLIPKADAFTKYMRKKDSDQQSSALSRQYIKAFLTATLPHNSIKSETNVRVSTPNNAMYDIASTPPPTPQNYNFVHGVQTKLEILSPAPSSSAGSPGMVEQRDEAPDILLEIDKIFYESYPECASPFKFESSEAFLNDLASFAVQNYQEMEVNDSQDQGSSSEDEPMISPDSSGITHL